MKLPPSSRCKRGQFLEKDPLPAATPSAQSRPPLCLLKIRSSDLVSRSCRPKIFFEIYLNANYAEASWETKTGSQYFVGYVKATFFFAIRKFCRKSESAYFKWMTNLLMRFPITFLVLRQAIECLMASRAAKSGVFSAHCAFSTRRWSHFYAKLR